MVKFQFFIPELWDFILQIVGDFCICHAVNWEPFGQFTSNFAQLLELIVLRSVYFLVKFRFFIQELWERKSLQILYECWQRAYRALLAQLFINILSPREGKRLQLSSSSIKSTQKSSLSLSVSHIIFSAWKSLSSLSISSFSCSGCFQARAVNFPFLVLAIQINCIYIFLNIVR
jgi:hypothetical protein